MARFVDSYPSDPAICGPAAIAKGDAGSSDQSRDNDCHRKQLRSAAVTIRPRLGLIDMVGRYSLVESGPPGRNITVGML